jgi:two-component system cell cycle sensor histidine kinase/response regulator CckA
VGHGTTFKLYLPRLADATSVETAATPPPALGNEVVLLVEDEDTIRELIREVLGLNGYTVLTASTPEEAIRIATSPAPIDLLISDVIMPGMGGRELARNIREARPGIRVLFVSGYPEQAISRSGALETGVTFLQKPFTPDTLAAKVRVALAAADAAAAGSPVQ